eukprot:407567_1
MGSCASKVQNEIPFHKVISLASEQTQLNNNELYKKIALILINGFIRKATKLLQTHVIVPDDINLMCLTFYLQVEDYFAMVGYETKTSNSNKTIIQRANGAGSSFGNVSIKADRKDICQWTVKLNNIDGDRMFIGISSKYCDNYEGCFDWDHESIHYSYSINGNKRSKWESIKYGEKWSNGDIIGIKLDLIEKEIEFCRNGKSQGIAFKNIKVDTNIVYKLAICMYWRKDSVSIQGFEYI